MTKHRLFALITVATPILALLLLEGSLRIFGYGGDIRLVVDREIMGRKFLSINRLVGRRYFTGELSRIPEPPDEFFLPVKPANGIRIFCVGESTMAGFPYEYNGTAPSMLKAALEAQLPEHHLEVINVGMAAIGSAVVKDLMDDLVEFDPDLFIVYVGHNEFYGVFGAASSQGAASAPWMTDLYLRMLRLETFLLLRDALELGRGNGDGGSSLMEGLSHRASVRYQDDLYNRCRENFGRNLEEMISIARDADVPILFSMPVSNLSGIPPFVSLPSPLRDEASVTRLLTSAGTQLATGLLHEAIAGYQHAVSLDSGRADSWYGLGRSLQLAGRSEGALEAFTMARDLDGLRFRMSSDFGRALLRVADHHGVPVARVDSVFFAESEDGITGNQFLLEHVHPNIGGYALVAKSWSEAIARFNLLPMSDGPLIPAEALPSLSGVTAFDTAMGRIRISYLHRQWPFAGGANTYSFKPNGWVEELTLRFVNNEIPWQSVRYQMADRYLKSGNFQLARNEAFAVSRVLYYSYEPLLRIADYFLMEGNKEAALAAYRQCVAREENPFGYHQIGRLLLEQGNPADAAAAFGRSIRSHAETRYHLPERALASTHSLLGYALVQLNRLEEGSESLRIALQLDPGLIEARRILDTLGNE